MFIKVLVIGDIVGKPGRKVLSEELPGLVARERISFVIANAENAAGGSGVTPEIAQELFKAGASVLTTGDHVWKKREIVPYIEKESRLLRPANYPAKASGSGFTILADPAGQKIGVVNLIGRVFMGPADSAFEVADRAVTELARVTPLIFVDMHAEATSEKVAMGWFLDGRVTAVFGTHTHVQTADERVLPGGTAYITDLGMTGPYDSVLGRRKDRVLQALITLMPTSFDVAKGDVRLSGAIITCDRETGKATAIQRVQVRLPSSDEASGLEDDSDERASP